MKKVILTCLLWLIRKLYLTTYEQLIGSVEPAKKLAECIREKYQGENKFMEDCHKCEGLDYCLVCPGFRKVFEKRKGE